jgi:opacity protein-like surface antigen
MLTRPVSALRRLAPLALLLAPALALAQARGGRVASGATGPALDNVGVSLIAGLDIPSPSDLDVGPRFGVELMYGLSDMAPQLRADLGVRASFAYHNADFGSQWSFDVIPDLRLLVGATPRLALFGDLGVGIGVIRHNVDVAGFSDTHTVAAFVLGPGLSYALSPTLNLLAEVRFHFYTGGEGTFIALPSIGFQWR